MSADPRRVRVLAALCLYLCMSDARADGAAPAGAAGPYNVTLLQGGIGLARTLPADSSFLREGAAWSMTGWVRIDVPQAGEVALVSLGNGDRPLRWVLEDGAAALTLGPLSSLHSHAALNADAWHLLAATFDGSTARLYLDGTERAHGPLATRALEPLLQLAPVAGWPLAVRHFGGALAEFQIQDGALPPERVRALADHPPDFALTTFTLAGAGWPLQVHAWIGLTEPQDPWTLPQARAAPSVPRARPEATEPALAGLGNGLWRLGKWHLQAAPRILAGAAAVSSPGFAAADWLPATVPGTVLTTLIDRGIYPDPDYGLNNMAIPETLARQDYWYRTEFTPPPDWRGRRLTLDFEGINYAAEVWLNGERLGTVRGAFIRGLFDISGRLRPGRSNALAVRICPPPHPGIPSEESIRYGPGENGGALALDGPTFIDTEGWDWIPAMRDRDSGLWQDVRVEVGGPVRILDPDVVTRLPLPRTEQASLLIRIPLDNAAGSARLVTVEAAFDDVRVSRRVRLPPGQSEVRFDAADLPQLNVRHPLLWWPNGYGDPSLHTLHVTVRQGQQVSATRDVRFGMRQITYELSLFDSAGRLRRVEIDPTSASARGERLVDVRHAALKQVPNGWAASLTRAGEQSAAVHDVPTQSLAPYLVIRVNGTPIAARGGSWGMDDSRKRSSRARLEPYFRLHREAHLNIIRNWLGQNTEETFYDLADEYGLLVLNDFWESTQDFQLEAQDPALFLANARDTILRYRHHPCIAVWFGRNEGVPQPILNEGLDDLIATLDGTRYYTGSSNRVNLQDSGPYSYRAPVEYFTHLARGFAVEVGTPSLSTLESLEASIPPADRWPLSDTIAYHDWHFGGNGDVKSFMSALQAQFGAADSLEDFERKAQMMNYVDYRAVFEGFLAHLWSQNSGRLLWMTHPAWPSNHWQIYSADYDTHAAYYGVKKANEPLHVQLNLDDYALAVANTTREDRMGLALTSRILTLDGRVLAQRQDRLDAPANAVTTLEPLALADAVARDGVDLVALTLKDAAGNLLSENLYWPSRDDAAMRALDALPAQPVRISGHSQMGHGERVVAVTLENTGTVPVLEAKLTLVDDAGQRILPAYYSDNYLWLLPGEPRGVDIHFAGSASFAAHVRLRGWNVQPREIAIGGN
jgi:hypothetical protein